MKGGVRYFIGLQLLGALAVLYPAIAQNHTAAHAAQPPLVLTTPDNDGVLIRYASLVFDAVGQRSHLDIRVEVLPKTRALVAANEGDADGVANRVMGLEQDYPNLRRVKVSHLTVQHIVFARKPDIILRVHDFSSLKAYVMQTGGVVGYLGGSKKAAEELSDLSASHKLALKYPEQAFGMLELDRIAAYLAGPGMVNRAIFKSRPNQQGIREIGVFSRFALYPYVHVKHTALIPKLEAAIQSIKDDGTLDRIRKSIEE